MALTPTQTIFGKIAAILGMVSLELYICIQGVPNFFGRLRGYGNMHNIFYSLIRYILCY